MNRPKIVMNVYFLNLCTDVYKSFNAFSKSSGVSMAMF